MVIGRSWLPFAELVAWAVMAWTAGRRQPERSLAARAGIGALTTVAVLGSEWGHNLAHLAAAQRLGKPADAVRIVGGMPLLVYYQLNDRSVTPRQHMFRSLGGPLFNLLLAPLAWLWLRLAPRGSVAHEVAGAAFQTNLVLGAVSLLPIPGIDGGPLLKWGLVERGRTPQQADSAVRKVNLGLSGGLAVATGVALKRRKWLPGALLALLAASALAVGMRWIEE